MKRLFHIIATSVLGTAMAIGTGFALANKQNVKQVKADNTVTITPATSGWNGTRGEQTGTVSGITVVTDDGLYNSQMRIYASASFEISSSVGNFTKIVLTINSGSFTGVNAGSYTSGTWTGDASSVTFSNTAQVRVTNIVVTLKDGGGVDPDPDPTPEGTITLDFTSSAYGISTTRGNQTLTGDGTGLEFNKNTSDGAQFKEAVSPNPSYVLFGKQGCAFRNTTAPEGKYLSHIGWTYSGLGSESVILSISYDSDVLTGTKNATTLDHAVQNGTVSLDLDNIDNCYFYIYVTNAYNCQIVSFTLTWSDKTSAGENMTIKNSSENTSPFNVEYGNVGMFFYAYNDSSTSLKPTWTVSDDTVLNLTTGYDDGHCWIKGLKPGTAKLYAELEGYNKATANITVVVGDLETITVTGSMSKTEYASNEAWSPAGLVVTANYEYGYSVVVTEGITWNYSPATPALNVSSVIATATYGGKSASSTAQTVTVTAAAGTIDNPFTVAQALDATPASGSSDPVYVRGIVVGTPNIDVTKYYNATFNIGDSANSETTLNIFRIKDIGNENFSDANKIRSGDTVVVYGVLTTYNSTKELTTSASPVSGYLISVEQAPIEYTSISWFYGDGNISTTASGPYDYKGTVIGIVGNSYYLQEGNYGIMVYGGTTTPPAGMKVGDLVGVNSQVINYKGYLVESNGAVVASILGDGQLPAASVVNTVSGFNSVNQSTYVTFNGLKLGAASLTWSSEFSAGSTDGIATVQDSAGTEITVFVNKFVANGADIVAKLNSLVETDTFDIAKGVKAIATGGTSAGSGQLSIFSADNITIHHQDADLVQDWIDDYMYMDDPLFDGDGTGKCVSDNLYITAKRALVALGEANVTKFRTNEGSKYTAALARYNEWARINGDTKPFEGDEIVPAQTFISNNSNSNTTPVVAIVVISIVLVSSAGLFLAIRKRKHQ